MRAVRVRFQGNFCPFCPRSTFSACLTIIYSRCDGYAFGLSGKKVAANSEKGATFPGLIRLVTSDDTKVILP